MVARLPPAAVAALMVLAQPVSAAAAQQRGGADTGSTLDGVYTIAQAQRGGEAYRKHCDECHVAAAVTGAPFRRAWAGRPLYDFYQLIRTTMPNDNPGRLGRGQYADIVAYLLRLSGMPPGERDLPSDSAGLSRIRIDVPIDQ